MGCFFKKNSSIKSLIVLFLAMPILQSCGSDSDKTAHNDDYLSASEIAATDYRRKLELDFSIDTSFSLYNCRYSIDFDSILNRSTLLVDNFSVIDIYSLEGLNFIKIQTGFMRKLILTLEISTHDLKKILDVDSRISKMGKNGNIIFILHSISKLDGNFTSDVENGEITVEFPRSDIERTFLGTGKVIHYEE